METPSSTRRVTRSQTFAALNNNTSSSSSNNIPVSRKIEDSEKSLYPSGKIEDSEKSLSISRQRNEKQQDRHALIDITNDSPIVGLASGNLGTPSSFIVKQRGSRVKNTPGSGEALLRGQVKILLQKVEEEAELSKHSLESRSFLQLVNSSMVYMAPTPANTPQISNLSGDGFSNNSTGLASVPPSPIVEERIISQLVNHIFDGKNKENSESEKSLITRSLLLDFSEKFEVSDASDCSFELTYQEVEQGASGCNEKPSAEDDDASIWSIQVNASTHDEDEEEIAEEEEDRDEEEDYFEDIEEDVDDGGLLDELCEGLNKISMNERVAPKFAGKHTRFVYNSDDELVEEEEEENCAQSGDITSASPNILRLKGLPTPKGQHLRFPEDEEGRHDSGKSDL